MSANAPATVASLAKLACAILPVVALGACSTEDLHQELVFVNDPSSNSQVGLYIIRHDAIDPNTLAPQPVSTTYQIKVDGKFAAWDASIYIDAPPNIPEWRLPLPAGSHVVSIIDDTGLVAATSPPVETTPRDPTRSTVDAAIAFFGNASTMNARALVNDPAAVPAGDVHVRVLNALADHQPIQVVQCPAHVAGNGLTVSSGGTNYTAGDCQPRGNPISYGDAFETDATSDMVATLGFYWSAPGALAPVVEPVDPGTGTGGFMTRIPVQMRSPSDACPSCFFKIY